MHIDRITLHVPDPEHTARFFGDVLSAHSKDTGNTIEVALGRSRLALQQGEQDPDGYYHLAFDIPGNAIVEARDVLRQRVDILPAGDDGIVTASPEWDASSVYFNAPGNLNLELIARHRLPNTIDRPFAMTDILNISEVGIPVPSTEVALHDLSTAFGLQPFGEPSDAFAPVGSDDGLLIVVKEGRTWFPTDNQQTTSRPLRIELGGVTGHATLGHYCVITGA